MAYVNSTRVANYSVFEKIANLFAALSTALERRRVYAKTLEELNRLGARDLADLGIDRSMITSIAREAAFGK